MHPMHYCAIIAYRYCWQSVTLFAVAIPPLREVSCTIARSCHLSIFAHEIASVGRVAACLDMTRLVSIRYATQPALGPGTTERIETSEPSTAPCGSHCGISLVKYPFGSGDARSEWNLFPVAHTRRNIDEPSYVTSHASGGSARTLPAAGFRSGSDGSPSCAAGRTCYASTGYA